MTNQEQSLKQSCSDMRSTFRALGTDILGLKLTATRTLDPYPDASVDKSEVLANITLAYRHIEDAIMRLGKTIQALDGGVSCYDGAAKRPATSQEITDRARAIEEKVAVCKEQASDRCTESLDPAPAPFHAVPAKRTESYPELLDDKSYSP